MSQNPFGEGGFDMGSILAQAQQMQQQLMAAQASLAEAEVEGSVAGGAVSVTITGAGDLRGVQIKPEAIDGTDADALADLGDLIVAAWRDAKARSEALAKEKMAPLTENLGGLGGLAGGLGGALGGGENPDQPRIGF